jgi:hypothetical protein
MRLLKLRKPNLRSAMSKDTQCALYRPKIRCSAKKVRSKSFGSRGAKGARLPYNKRCNTLVNAPTGIEGYAIVSENGMIATAKGAMPRALKFDADQEFF